MPGKYSFKESLGRLCAEISSSLGKKIEIGFREKGFQYTSQEWTVISYLYNQGKQSQNQLTEATKYNKVAISRIIKRFELQKLISREIEESDKRLNMIALTKQGSSVYQQLSEIAAKVINSSFSGLSKDDIANSIATLQMVNQNLQKI